MRAAERTAQLASDREALLTALGKLESPKIDARILGALARVPRERFVPEHEIEFSYKDSPLPIGRHQTISQPQIVATMTQLVAPAAHETALEIGTGSGYQTAVLAELVHRVYSIERIAELAESAKRRLHDLGYRNIELRVGDGWDGWPECAPFDVIVVTAAAPVLPEPLLEQLAPGGRMIAPIGTARTGQELLLVTKDTEGSTRVQDVESVCFVPFERGVVWSAATDE